jgi:predicted transcriptional regulator
MNTIKKEAIDIITNLPDDASIEDIMYKLYVLDKIKKGQEDIEKDNFVTTDELRKEIDLW